MCLLAAVALGLLWIYWPTLVGLVGRWAGESNYTHGFLVLPFCLYLL